MSSSTLHEAERLLDQLTPGEQAILLEKIARRMRLAVSHSFPPRDLYGLWKDKFPQNADLDAALHEIRQAWDSEWSDDGTFTETRSSVNLSTFVRSSTGCGKADSS